MEEILKSISEKISSYNIFNNLFPGIIFCSVMTKITRFNFATDTIIEQFFMWYFIGMVISRIGSIFVEDTLKKIKIKGKPYLVFADYKQYTPASEANPFIATLSETNNTYRTTISLLICIGAFYFYDSFIYDWIIKKCAVGNKLVALVGGVFLIILFIKSYKKHTEYFEKQVEKYMNEHSSSQ